MIKRIILILLLLPSIAIADFSLPSTRVVTWQGNVGVKDGIPTDRTQCGSTITSTGDTTDRTTTIQNALNACGAGQYVLLGAGSFTISRLGMRSNVTLRGSGMGVTTLVPSSQEYIYFGSFGATYGTAVGVTDGLTKGSTTITTESNHGWSAGDHIVIDQLNNAGGDPIITNAGDGGNWLYGGRVSGGGRAMQQVVKLVAPTSGTTATLEIPIYLGFDAGQTPQAAKVPIAVENAGVEALTINGASHHYNITVFVASNCWLKDVELNGMNPSGIGIYLSGSYRITITRCKIHQATGVNASDNFLITTIGTGSAYLIENNVLYNATNPITLQSGASGCVIAYNYITDVHQEVYPTANRYGIGLHGCHQVFNLIEGNIIDGAFFASDNYWGSNSHNTLLRNRIVMDYTKVDQQVNLGVGVHQTYYNIIGNYLGGTDTAYELAGIPYDPSSEYVYSTGSGSYSTERSTMLRHGNWDGYNDAQVWCDTSGEPGCQGGSNDHTLPSSLYLASKPSWFADIAWPPVNPATPSVADIPAKVFYDTEAWPEAATQYALTVTKAGTGTGSVTSSPAGMDCGDVCVYEYAEDTEVTLTATPTGDNVFAGWSGTGGCTGTSTCVLTMSAAKAATATFIPALPVRFSGGGFSGTIQ